jgi:hypothetical protein
MFLCVLEKSVNVAPLGPEFWQLVGWNFLDDACDDVSERRGVQGRLMAFKITSITGQQTCTELLKALTGAAPINKAALDHPSLSSDLARIRVLLSADSLGHDRLEELTEALDVCKKRRGGHPALDAFATSIHGGLLVVEAARKQVALHRSRTLGQAALYLPLWIGILLPLNFTAIRIWEARLPLLWCLKTPPPNRIHASPLPTQTAAAKLRYAAARCGAVQQISDGIHVPTPRFPFA